MSTPYEIRTNDNGKTKKQSMAELKLRRLTELNQRLQEDLNRRRIPVSEAAMEYVLVTASRCGCMLMILNSLIAFTDKEPKVPLEHVQRHLVHDLLTSPYRTSWYQVDGAQSINAKIRMLRSNRMDVVL